MSSLVGRSGALSEGAQTASIVFFTLDGMEYPSVVPQGRDRWDTVAAEVARLLRCDVRAEEAPTYDQGIRSWTLPMVLSGRKWWRRSETLSVAVRWDDQPVAGTARAS